MIYPISTLLSLNMGVHNTSTYGKHDNIEAKEILIEKSIFVMKHVMLQATSLTE